MREIKLSSARNFKQTKYAVECIAWASNRRGHNSWKADNVANSIYQYLMDNDVHLEVLTGDPDSPNVRKIDNRLIRQTINKLVQADLAIVVTNNAGIVTKFEFKPDIILTGHSVRFKHSAYESPTMRVENTAGLPNGPYMVTLKNDYNENEFPKLPLPEVPHRRYLADELNTMLDQYSELDHDAYANWVDQVYLNLKIILDMAT